MNFEARLASLQPLDAAAVAAARARQDQLTKPPGSLGRLEDLSIQLAGIAGRCPPPIPERRTVLVFAGDHGVTAQGISAFPAEVTPQMVLNFLHGGAAINVLARQSQTDMVIVDAGVAAEFKPHDGLVRAKIAPGTMDFTQGPAMTRAQALASLELGLSIADEAVAQGAQMLACGDMGIGNTTPSAALTAVICGLPAVAVTGAGTGLATDGVRRKVAVIEQAIDLHRPRPDDGLGLLSALGGFEIGAIAGAMIGAAQARVPMVVDGFIATAGALLAAVLAPAVKPYLIGGHRSQEPGHIVALAHLGLTPLLDLGLRLGEGTGAVLAFSLVEAAARILNEMATFGEAGVAGGEA